MPIAVALLALVVGLAGEVVVSNPELLGTRGSLLLGQVVRTIPFALSVAALHLRARETFAWHAPTPAGALLAAGCGLALWIAAGGLLQLQYALWPLPPEVRAFFEKLHAELDLWPPWQGALSLTAIAIGPAVSEEIIFRGALLGALKHRLGGAAAVVVSAALFALIHIPPYGYRVPFVLALGLALGALRLRTGSIVPGVIAHAVLNATTVIVTDRLDAGAADSIETVSTAGGAAALALGSIAAAGLARRLSTRPAA